MAAVVDVKRGQVTTAAAAHLDPAGSIAGHVLSDDAYLSGEYAYVKPFGTVSGLDSSYGSATWYLSHAALGGQYRLDRLGPYAWPIEFSGSKIATEWSGNATNRFEAKMVQVHSGQTSYLDMKVRRAAIVPFDKLDLVLRRRVHPGRSPGADHRRLHRGRRAGLRPLADRGRELWRRPAVAAGRADRHPPGRRALERFARGRHLIRSPMEMRRSTT